MSRGWGLVAGVAVVTAVVSLLANASGVDGPRAARALALVVNAGTVWAGQAVLAGWLVRRRGAAALAGPVVGLLSLVVYYALGGLTGLTPWSGFADNLGWFVAAAVAGVPLGLVGSLARRRGASGLLARLVVPVGAVLEPLVRGWWVGGALGIAAAVLLVAGLAGGGVVLVRVRGGGSPFAR